MNERWVYFGGAIVPESEAVVSVRHRAFLHGESLFETLRAEFGRPIWLAEHLSRLNEAAAELEFPSPPPLTEETLIELLRRNSLREARLRITLTREVTPGWIVTSEPLEMPSDAAAYREGVSVTLWTPAWPPWGGAGAVVKSGSWMALASAARKARAAGAWEAIRLDAQGRLCEGAASNLFWIRDRALETPARTLGILNGIIRTKLIQLAPALGLTVRELDNPAPARAMEAQEVLITNSLWEILPVVRWSGQPVGNGVPGSWAARLRSELRALPGGPLSFESLP